MRIALPDQPGSLGGVASALATVGADIQWVEIVSRGGGRVTDDFMVSLPDHVMPDEAVSVCHAMSGVQVLWCSRFPAGTGISLDIELLQEMVSAPEQALSRLIEAAPEVFHIHWAVLVDPRQPAVEFASDMAPDLGEEELTTHFAPLADQHVVDLPESWVPDWMETVAAVVPVSARKVIIVGRHGGPEFEPSELARLRYLASLGAAQSRD